MQKRKSKAKCKICRGIKPDPIKPTCYKYDCQLEWAKRHAEKAKIKRDKEFNRETRKRKQKLKSRSDWLREAQQWFNKYVRIRDKALPCISCGRFHSGQYHAGHYRSVGACPELRFNELNCHKQCSACNNHLSGNISEYRAGLLDRIGASSLDYIEGSHGAARYSIEDIKEIKAKYRKKCKELENEN